MRLKAFFATVAAALAFSGASKGAPAPFNPAFNTTYDVTQGGAHGRRHASASAGPCNVQIAGVSPSVCFDFVNSVYTGALTTDTGVHSSSGVTCTGSQVEQTTVTLTSGNILIIVDATYPTTVSNPAYSFTLGGGTYMEIFSGSNPYYGGASATSRTGSIETAAYYYPTNNMVVSYAGDAALTSTNAAPSIGSNSLHMCNNNGTNPLTTPFRSFRLYQLGSTTLTNAQVQLAATQ